jgi:parallel beta-helix repeat protein
MRAWVVLLATVFFGAAQSFGPVAETKTSPLAVPKVARAQERHGAQPFTSRAIRYRVGRDGKVPFLHLESGAFDLAKLARILERDRHRGIVTKKKDDVWLLQRTTVVAPGASLWIVGKELRLLSTHKEIAGLEARGGRIRIENSTVHAWDAARGAVDRNVADGRAWVLARDRARMDVLGSRMEMLGYDESERYGAAWRTKGTRGTVDGSIFSGNFYGLYTFDVAPMRVTDSVFADSHSYGLDPHSNSRGFVIERNVFKHNGKHGMILAVGCSDAVIRNNKSFGNDGSGIVVFEGSNHVVIENNELTDNQHSGIDISDSADVRATGNTIYGNSTGFTVHDGSSAIVIRDNRIAANRVDGIKVSSGARVRQMAENHIDFNGRAGIMVDTGAVAMGPSNTVSDNLVGLWFLSPGAGSHVYRNDLVHNVYDGISLSGLGAAIEHNRIAGNGKAGLSLDEGRNVDAFLKLNDLTGSELETRVRGS